MDIIEILRNGLPSIESSVTGLRPKAQGRKELCGPCPFPGCDAKQDGFIVWPGTDRFLCRKCPTRDGKLHTGDKIDFHQAINGGIGKVELAKMYGLDVTPAAPVTPVPQKKRSGLKHHKGTYIYNQGDGTPHLKVEKYVWDGGGKDFYPYKWTGAEWATRAGLGKGFKHVPYNLQGFVDEEKVYIPEGEKDCDTLASLGVPATTNCGGGGQWQPELNEYFRGKHVVILEDNDNQGKRHTEKIITGIKELAKSIKVVRLPGPEGSDVTDWLGAGHSKDELLRIVEQSDDVKATDAFGSPDSQNSPQQKASLATPEGTRLKGRIINKPDPMEYSILYGKEGLIPRYIVGVLTGTGGAGKSFWLMKLAVTAASGGCMGPIKAVRDTPTLFIAGEDPEDELNRRFWNICNGAFPPHLYAVSVYGQVGPLMRLDGNTPVKAEGFYWLEGTLKNFPGLELLILDPKSRFYGLDENNNDHATQWIQALEYLAKRYKLTILFSHHTSKGTSDKISQGMSRGASAIVDGCRWQGGIARMNEKLAIKYDIKEADRRSIIEFDVPKSNYTSALPGSLFFKRDENGVPHYYNLNDGKLKEMTPAFLEIFSEDGGEYTIRDLRREAKGKHIADEMKERFPSFSRSGDMNRLIYALIEKGILFEKIVDIPHGSKKILQFSDRYRRDSGSRLKF